MDSVVNRRCAFFGTSEFIGSIQKARFLRGLIRAGTKPVVVVTAPDNPNPRGGGRTSVPPAVKLTALESGIPVLQPRSLKGFSEELARHEVELSLVAGYGNILPPEVLAVPKFGSLNVHPSLLPRWRGPTPIQAAIVAGDLLAGVTIIQMDEQMDHGPIIATREFPLGERAWTALAISDALADLGVELFLEILEPWVLGKIPPVAQNHEAATYSHILKKEDGHIDWSKSANAIERMVRAFQPWPGTYTFWRRGGDQVRLVIEEVVAVPNRPDRPGLLEAQGRVMEVEAEIAVGAGRGLLMIRTLRREGGRSMPAREFLPGHRNIVGAALGPKLL